MPSAEILSPRSHRNDWQQALRDAVRDLAELAALLELPVAALESGQHAAADFPLLVPRSFIARMRKGDPRDPLLLQILPTARELEPAAGFGPDPVGELVASHRGVVEKYAGRALLITTGSCPVHCRYCFRREFPYSSQLAARDDFEPALNRLRKRTDLDEIILSGGDPLSLSNHRLEILFAKLAECRSLKRVRIHTRFPVMLPERVDDGLVGLLTTTPFDTVVVVHANHANELDASVADALRALRNTGATLLNQSVLLAGVNDDVNALANLSERLFACGALPYYLHVLDRVAGAAHFDLPESTALALHAALRGRLSGYLVPRLVREIPGQSSKTPLNHTPGSESSSEPP